jgi:serine/threonine protein kinase
MIANQFKVIKTLGSGATASVKLVQDVNSGKNYACKVMK